MVKGRQKVAGDGVSQRSDGERTKIRCSGCGMVGHVNEDSPVTSRGHVVMERRHMTYVDCPDVYIYPGPDRSQIELSPETKSKMAAPELLWSKATYNMESLMSRYSDKFPIIVKVSRGYYGKFHLDTLASSQVARLHTWGMQERVRARDTKGREISIPLDYEIEFEVIEKKGSKKKKSKHRPLRSIIRDYDLPVVVQFPKKQKWHFRIGSQRYFTKDFGAIEIMKVYTQRFLKGNTIHNGVIDTKVMLVPMYVNVTFNVAIGAKGQSEEEWEGLQNMYTHAISHINFDAIKGTRDMTEFPSELVPIAKDDLTDDGIDDDVIDGTDANANLTNVANRENNKSHLNGDVPRTTRGDQNNERKDDIISIPLRQNLLMQVSKRDLEKGNSVRSHATEGERRSMLRSDFSDYSSLSGDRSAYRRQNVVHVSLGDDAQVITQEMYDQDFGHAAPIIRHRPPSSVHGSTIINVTSDDAEILNPYPPPAYYNSISSRSESNLRRTFSDTDFHDNSVFLTDVTAQPQEFPGYATRRRYKQSHPSFTSSDISRYTRHGKRRFGQVISGGAPVEERRYHSMKDLSRIDNTYESGVSRVASFRSATMTPSHSHARPKNPNVYVQLRDERPQDRYVKRIEFREEAPVSNHQVAYTRRAGREKANKMAATQVRSREHAQGVYFTDGYQNYPLQNKRTQRPDPPAYHDLDNYAEVVHDTEYTRSEPVVYNTQSPPMQSPVLSSSSNEDNKRFFIMYENGSSEVPVMTETTENGEEEDDDEDEEYIYQGSMMLRKGRDFEQMSVGDESMIDIPVEDIRYPRSQTMYSSSSHHEQSIPMHDLHDRQRVSQSFVSRKEQRPTHAYRTDLSSEVRRMAYDEVDADTEDYIEGVQYADMTKGAAEHWGRVMDFSTTSSSHHKVPIELEGKGSRGIIESMFDGGHHSHSFTGRDRSVCRRLEQQRQERSYSHRELSLNRARQQRQAAAGRSSERFLSAAGSSRAHHGGIGNGAASGSASAAGGGGASTFEFRTNRNEVWSGETQRFGVAPLTTSEQETSKLLGEVEDHRESASPVGALNTSTEAQDVSKGSFSSYEDSSMSSQSGEMVVNGDEEKDMTRSYHLPGLGDDADAAQSKQDQDNVPIANNKDTAGPAASAAAAAMAEGNLEIQGDQRISRKTARELTRTGSVRSLREVYARSRSPSSSQRDKPRMTVAPATEVFTDILNKPTTSTANGAAEKTSVTSTSNVTTSQDGNVILRSKTSRTYNNSGSGSRIGNSSPRGGDQDLAWQETQSYHLESIRDSIRDLDEYLKNQGGDTDSHSLSSAASSKHLEHFSFALTDPATY